MNTYQLIVNNPYITAEEIAAQLKKSSRTIENYIEQLKKEKIILRKGPKLGGYWEIVDSLF